MTLRNFIFKLQNIDTQIQGASSSKGWLADRELIFVPHFQMNNVNVDGAEDDEQYSETMAKGWLTVDSEVLSYTIEEDAVLVEVGHKEDVRWEGSRQNPTNS